jgi:signal transduction histidine kinase
MALSRPSPPSWEAVSLRQVIDEGLAFVAPRCAGARVRVVRQIDAALPPLSADRTQLVQVVVNLALNAIQAMPDGGVLRVEARPDPVGIALAVEDDGVGMDDEVLAKVFDPFFTTKREGEGTGLGLVVVHGIVTLHGGTMQVQSERGRGTRMTLRLPLHPPLGAEHRRKVPRAVG